MNYLVFKIKRHIFIQTLLSSVLILSLIFAPNTFAQGEAEISDRTTNENEEQPEEETSKIEERQAPEKENEESGLEYLNKQSPAYRALGRELTPKERAAFGSKLTYDQIVSQFLHKEYRLVVIRVALALGESDDATQIAFQYQSAKPYDQVYKEFLNCRETYGSILNCLKAQNLNQPTEEIFEETALIAYYKVFGVKKEDLTPKEKEWLFSFLKDNDALTLSKMIEVLVKSMTDNDKRQILFKLLNKIKRPDLKENKTFVNKILKQQFTYESLEKLLLELKH